MQMVNYRPMLTVVIMQYNNKKYHQQISEFASLCWLINVEDVGYSREDRTQPWGEPVEEKSLSDRQYLQSLGYTICKLKSLKSILQGSYINADICCNYLAKNVAG